MFRVKVTYNEDSKIKKTEALLAGRSWEDAMSELTAWYGNSLISIDQMYELDDLLVFDRGYGFEEVFGR